MQRIAVRPRACVRCTRARGGPRGARCEITREGVAGRTEGRGLGDACRDAEEEEEGLRAAVPRQRVSVSGFLAIRCLVWMT